MNCKHTKKKLINAPDHIKHYFCPSCGYHWFDGREWSASEWAFRLGNMDKKDRRRPIKKGAFSACPACKGRGCLACDGNRKKDGAE